MPLLEKRLVDDVLLGHRLDLLVGTVALYGLLWLLVSMIQIASVTLRTYLGERLVAGLRERLFLHCEKLSLAFSHREHTGRTSALFTNDVPVVAGLFSTTTVTLLGSIVGLWIGAAVMFQLSWQLALVTVVAPPLMAGAVWVVTRPLRPASRKAQDKAAELSQRLQETLLGIREVVAFGREHSQGVQFAQGMAELVRLRMRVAFIDTGLQTGQSLFSLVVTMVVLGYGGYLVIQGETTIGTLVAMRSLFGLVYGPATQLFGLINGVQKALASSDRVYAFLDEEPGVQERSNAKAPRAVAGRLMFDHVSFGYQRHEPVLRNITVDVQPGEMVALVGPSGAGKSTLASLIARFYDPDEGRVLLDDTDIRDLTLHGLRDQIGLVFQDTFLFASSIRENIGFGRLDAEEREIVAAAQAANAWEFIERLPSGLDTEVGQRGVRLSEGQKQRLAIARAFLRNPRILILDEPTSALDARSEHLLQAALERLIYGRTTFVIAHRLATIRRADRILVIDEGRLVEQGTHMELMQAHGLYRELFELQFGGGSAVRQNGHPQLIAAGNARAHD